jgi:hypothetical protein
LHRPSLAFFEALEPVDTFGNEGLALTKGDDEFKKPLGLYQSTPLAAITDDLH